MGAMMQTGNMQTGNMNQGAIETIAMPMILLARAAEGGETTRI
jgi:hypothetical protein